MRGNSTRNTIIIISIILFSIFLILKTLQLGIVGNWSWWQVTSPVWLPMVILGLLFFYTVLVGILKYHLRKKRYEKKFNVK